MSKWILTTAAVLSMTAAFGQGFGRRGAAGTPPDPQKMVQMRVQRLATLLDLTDAQKTTATQIFTDAHTAAVKAHESMRDTREQLRTAIKDNNTSSIDSLANTIGTLTGQLTSIEGKAEAAFIATLTAEQKAKYEAMPGGPGGRIGPGGGPGMPGRMMGPSGMRGRQNQ